MEEINNNMSDFNLDEQEINNSEMVEVPKKAKAAKTKVVQPVIDKVKETETPINCLRKEKVIVRYIPRERGNITNPKHVLYGGMAENAVRTYTVPKMSNGIYRNPLTDSEKKNDIMNQIVETCGLKTLGAGICFSIPVDNVVGLDKEIIKNTQ
jgi:hypothetical protein